MTRRSGDDLYMMILRIGDQLRAPYVPITIDYFDFLILRQFIAFAVSTDSGLPRSDIWDTHTVAVGRRAVTYHRNKDA
jgi:hypothetical protein